MAQPDGRKGFVQQAQPPTAVPACLCRSHDRQAAPALQDWPPQKDRTWRIIDAMDAMDLRITRPLRVFHKRYREDGRGQTAFGPSMRGRRRNSVPRRVLIPVLASPPTPSIAKQPNEAHAKEQRSGRFWDRGYTTATHCPSSRQTDNFA